MIGNVPRDDRYSADRRREPGRNAWVRAVMVLFLVAWSLACALVLAGALAQLADDLLQLTGLVVVLAIVWGGGCFLAVNRIRELTAVLRDQKAELDEFEALSDEDE